ncbi:coenzyme F420 hydrogenase/dehydrogenase beta subunit N-terminal domain-containing protein [Sphingosinicella sp. YJ22]|uniref:Coenzyme F420 hydrogenase/dehydrogenase, beta subunit C-terminal domain n=1 Tax=Sphingosinicella sp. YJ22 TaxID=1104780 RepID=UPI0014096CBF|nr:coenzyme F420 hydrogenase/dehydrogenase beta subunit N-terminal domain-containing protein [Sphingosinicella sp. YJ22]
MERTPRGPQPVFAPGADLPELAWEACPGKGVDYPKLYIDHYGRLPDSWLVGNIVATRTGHAADPAIRAVGASGGVTTAVLIHLLESGRIDGAIVVRQGVPAPLDASAVIATSRDEIIAAAQSVYIPVSVLDILPRLEPGKRYAVTLVPEQAAALRRLQASGHPKAQQIEFVLGPYTGTALYPAAIDNFLRSHGVRKDDPVTSLEWRAGEWPGYLEIRTKSGKVLRSKKVYYNFLIPFFVTRASLQSMDFANEFCDLSVGDAWSPKFEAEGGGHSVVVTRSAKMEAVIAEMVAAGQLALEPEDNLKATEMHGHMIDFKKRGGHIRNTWRRRWGRAAPDYGMRPSHVPASRKAVELAISGLFVVGGTGLARGVLRMIPEKVIGPVFNKMRLSWKNLSKPTKRKGLADFKMIVDERE